MDKYYDDCIAEINKLEDIGSAVLSFYIDQARYDHSKVVLRLLYIAKQVNMTQLLHLVISKLKSEPPIRKSTNERYTPELQNAEKLPVDWSKQYSLKELAQIRNESQQREIGWSDFTYAQILVNCNILLSQEISVSSLDSCNPEVNVLCGICETEFRALDRAV